MVHVQTWTTVFVTFWPTIHPRMFSYCGVASKHRAIFGWLLKTKTKVITQANHRGCKKTVQPIRSQSNSRLILRMVLLSNRQCEYMPSLVWEVLGFGFVPQDMLRMLPNLCRPIRKCSNTQNQSNHTIRKSLYSFLSITWLLSSILFFDWGQTETKCFPPFLTRTNLKLKIKLAVNNEGENLKIHSELLIMITIKNNYYWKVIIIIIIIALEWTLKWCL